MSIREQWLENRLKKLLARRSPPRSIAKDAEAQRDEIAGLLRTLRRFAPNDDLNNWWERFEDALLESMETHAWPTLRQVAQAGKVASPQKAGAQSSWQPDTLEIMAKAMNAGEPVGRGYIYGRGAVELLQAGLITKSTLDAYRSGLFFEWRDVYKEERAREMEAEALAQHEMAAGLVSEEQAEQRGAM